MSQRPHPWYSLSLSFAAVALSFIGVTAYTQHRMSAIDQAALEIADNAAPSIENLTSARTELKHVQVSLTDYVHQNGAPAVAAAAVRDSRRKIDQKLTTYLSLPPFPGEQWVWQEVHADLGQLDQAIERAFDEANHDQWTAASVTVDRDVRHAIDCASAGIARGVEFNAQRTHDLGLKIRRLRNRSMHVERLLDFIALLLAGIAARLTIRAVRAYTALLEANNQLVSQRADELECFAGTVAHDILSPLSAVELSLQGAARVVNDEKAVRWLERGRGGVKRVERIVRGLLDFARAGAPPEEAVSTDAKEVLDDLVSELQPAAAEIDAELVVEPFAASPVACSAAVLTSMVANLVRNAIKYLGDATVRRVTVRVLGRPSVVRFEVEDSGPGIAANLKERIFEPYVRAKGNRQPGIGLGLATVRRLALAHGGCAGVRSELGRGSLFWVELPRALPPAKLSASEEVDSMPRPVA